MLGGCNSPEPSSNKSVSSPFVSPLLKHEELPDNYELPVIRPLLQAFAEVQNLRPLNAPFSSPLNKDYVRAQRKGRKTVEEIPRPVKLNLIDHEAMIMEILTKKFVVPIANYIPEYTTKTLGMRKIVIRRPLHDPDACNALILYAPTEADLAASLKPKKAGMKGVKGLDAESTAPVHVVVDPVLSNILRPHQRAGVQFMYDCVTGVKGDYHGCIMADEMGKLNLCFCETEFNEFRIFL